MITTFRFYNSDGEQVTDLTAKDGKLYLWSGRDGDDFSWTFIDFENGEQVDEFVSYLTDVADMVFPTSNPNECE